jgi:two-component sensor histidine kinase
MSELIAAGIYGTEASDAALVVSELLSNALRHAGPLPGDKVRVGWCLDEGSLRLSVSDGGGQTKPELGQPTQSATGGRGLRIVERLSRCWGAQTDVDGTTVWAEVPIPLMTPVSVSGSGRSGSRLT